MRYVCILTVPIHDTRECLRHAKDMDAVVTMGGGPGESHYDDVCDNNGYASDDGHCGTKAVNFVSIVDVGCMALTATTCQSTTTRYDRYDISYTPEM